MTSEPTASTRTPQGSPPDLADRLDAVWQLAAVARALGGDSDALLTGLSAAVADAAGLEVDGLTEQQREQVLNEIRTTLHQAATFAAGSTLPGWDPDDDTLTTQGRASRRVADLITDVVAGRFPELADHLAAPGARFLDVGVGVAQISIELCRRYPLLHVTGVDINARPLRLAADNVAAADLNDRIDLRQADIAELADAESFTLAWIPMPFLVSRRRSARAERRPPSVAPWRLVAGRLLGTGHRHPGERNESTTRGDPGRRPPHRRRHGSIADRSRLYRRPPTPGGARRTTRPRRRPQAIV